MTPNIPEVNSFAGAYAIRSPQRGTMTLTDRGAFLHAEAIWDNGETRHGLAMPFGGRLVMAIGPRDKVEIGAYRITGDTMEGLWVPPGCADEDFAKCGREKSAGGATTGIWTIADAYAIDMQPYTGKVTMTPQSAATGGGPTPLKITWNLHDGDYHSFGLGYRDAVYTTFSFEPEKPHGVIVYEISRDKLHGTRIDNGSFALTTETLHRQS